MSFIFSGDNFKDDREKFIEIYILGDGEMSNEWKISAKTNYFEQISWLQRNITNVHDDFSTVMGKSSE